jgi:hypothetical protein
MEIEITQDVIDTVCNSLRASKHSLQQQLRLAVDKTKEDIIKSQLADVEHALEIFQHLES